MGPIVGDPSKATPPGADLQTAFANACNAMTAGEMAHAAGQFGLAFAGAEIALEMGVKKGMVEFTPELQMHMRAYLWQCSLHRSLCLTAMGGPAQTDEAVRCLTRCVALGEEMGDGEKARESLGLVAALQVRAGRAADCLGTVAKLLKLAREAGSIESEQVALLHQGGALGILQKYDQAIKALKQSQTMTTGDLRAEGDVCVALAKVYSSAGDTKNACEAANKAVALAEQEADVRRLETVQSTLRNELAYVN